MVTKKLWKALDNYSWSEFDHGCDNEDFKDPTAVGIAYTEIYDENDFPYHSMQIYLNMPKCAFEYYLDEELIHVEQHADLDECAEEIKNTTFQDWYGDFMQYCPEDYH